MLIKDLSSCTSSCDELDVKDLCEILSDMGYEINKLRGLILVLMFFVIVYYVSMLPLLYYIFG